jgi:hypothetical protein
MLNDLKKIDCLRSTKDFISCKLGGKGCQNIDEISINVCNGKTLIHNIIIVRDDFGNVNAIDKTLSYVDIHHSER